LSICDRPVCRVPRNHAPVLMRLIYRGGLIVEVRNCRRGFYLERVAASGRCHIKNRFFLNTLVLHLLFLLSFEFFGLFVFLETHSEEFQVFVKLLSCGFLRSCVVTVDLTILSHVEGDAFQELDKLCIMRESG
jgi:hypothetical protein